MKEFIHAIWLQFEHTSLLEWLGVLTGFACIYLATKNHILNWPIAIISVFTYLFIFYEAKLYGEVLLQGYFLLSSIYGWYFWIKKKKQSDKPIVSLQKKEWLWVLIAIACGSLLLSLFLDHYTNTDVPYIDGFCTAMSFVAQILLTRKVLQNWLIWLVVDIIYVPLLFHKNLPLSALLYSVLIFLAYKGYRDWKKLYQYEVIT